MSERIEKIIKQKSFSNLRFALLFHFFLDTNCHVFGVVVTFYGQPMHSFLAPSLAEKLS